ncbi:hypothetical protein H1Q59_06915 [Holosporaceae bacterium 'Namur']|nr:hypothetical protein [Holosporaceae bacterium 'Namur']
MRADEQRNGIESSNEIEHPQGFVCIITQELMEDPVIAPDGYSYEREAILRWMREHRNQSTMTRERMDPNRLVPNRNLKDAIEAHKAQIALQSLRVAGGREEVAATTSRNTYSSPKYSHVELMQKLQNDLSVRMQEVYIGTVVEQTLVGMAGVYTTQEGAMFRRDNESGHTWFNLKFATQQEYLKFIACYNTNFNGLIVDQGQFSEGFTKIAMNTEKLYEEASPKLGEFKGKAHDKVMEELANKLGVEYLEVYGGSAVEQRLVEKAGVATSQASSSYRMQENYTKKFNLRFVNNNEYNQFLNYYNQNFPGFILRASTYNAQPVGGQNFSSVVVDPNKLINQIATTLSNPTHAERVAEQAPQGRAI